MNTCYEGIGYLAVTVPAGTCGAGQVCMINTDGQADACPGGGRFMGACDEVRKGLAAVQVALLRSNIPAAPPHWALSSWRLTATAVCALPMARRSI